MTDWDDLRYLRAVGEAGTLAAAAQRLGVHASTVFRRLGQMEARLGARLFDRHRDGVSLTPAGEEALALARRLGAEVEALERRLAGRDTRPSGTVRLTTTDTLLRGGLAEVLAGFRRRHPEITLEVVTANPFLSLSRRDADVALRPTAAPPETLVGRRLADIATAVYAAPAYLAAAPAPENLGEHAWVAPDDSLGHLPAARWLRRQLPQAVEAARCNSLASVWELARQGAGVALLPCFLADADPALSRIHPPIPELTVGLWLLTHRDLRRVTRVRALTDHVHEALSARRPLFEGTLQEAAPPARG